MPVRKRKDRRKQSAGLFEWETVFGSEFDLFGDLADAGVAVDKDRRPDREEAHAAWQRLGAAFLAEFEAHNEHYVPWALAQFGDPR
jgi:hypothetical protein